MSNWVVDIKLPKTISTHPPELVGTKCSGRFVVQGTTGCPIGEQGKSGNNFIKKITRRKAVLNWESYKNRNGVIDWDRLGFAQGITPNRKEAFINAAQLMYDYITSNNITTKIGNVDIEHIIFPLIRRVIEGSNSNLENPEDFYDYCCEFVRKVLPHYENVMNKFKKERNDCPQQYIDIEAQVTFDLAQNVLEILNKEE